MNKRLKTDRSHISAGIDLLGEHSIIIQRVNDVPCIAVHRCRVEDGLHYTTADDESVELAIPIRPIYRLLSERMGVWLEELK